MNVIKHILLVDDDPNDVELTLTALAESNLANEVVIARDGTEALDYLYQRGKFSVRQGGLPAVVLLDLKMPKVSGIEVLSQIKADADLKLIPVVILTSSQEATDLEQCYQLGVNAYVVKPVQIKDFMNAIKQIGIFWAVINELPPGIRNIGTLHLEPQ
jgi:CheY-like chemotaxis protein